MTLLRDDRRWRRSAHVRFPFAEHRPEIDIDDVVSIYDPHGRVVICDGERIGARADDAFGIMGCS